PNSRHRRAHSARTSRRPCPHRATSVPATRTPDHRCCRVRQAADTFGSRARAAPTPANFAAPKEPTVPQHLKRRRTTGQASTPTPVHGASSSPSLRAGAECNRRRDDQRASIAREATLSFVAESRHERSAVSLRHCVIDAGFCCFFSALQSTIYSFVCASPRGTPGTWPSLGLK